MPKFKVDKKRLEKLLRRNNIPISDAVKRGKFYEEFYDWARIMSLKNVVLISEYAMPDDFRCIWQRKVKTLISSTKERGDMGNERTEKLFIYKNGLELVA